MSCFHESAHMCSVILTPTCVTKRCPSLLSSRTQRFLANNPVTGFQNISKPRQCSPRVCSWVRAFIWYITTPREAGCDGWGCAGSSLPAGYGVMLFVNRCYIIPLSQAFASLSLALPALGHSSMEFSSSPCCRGPAASFPSAVQLLPVVACVQ